ncbi:hypothetical protein [Duganella radicis]|uniref:Uncharacterized protein n=1 Tax=Duganella radicis TaxID=551988 RepID=A0A6L6PMF2_9BURK|nr:hypothetical protein [Duganella radicis]MTV39811.1 hypothetical protein [Duganella radicis]
MKYSVLLTALMAGIVPPAYSQCCGYGMSYDNVTVWPQPILHHAGEPEPKYKKPPLVTAPPNIQANASILSMNFPPAQRADVSDEAYDAVTRQFRAQDKLRDMLKNNPPEKVRDVFEQSAMIGAFMAMTQKSLKQHPQPPNVRQNLIVLSRVVLTERN